MINQPNPKYLTLKAGTLIYYTGDMANQPGSGMIVKVNPPDRWGPNTYNIRMDDGREWNGVHATNFEGPGHRFELESERAARRAQKIQAMIKGIAGEEAGPMGKTYLQTADGGNHWGSWGTVALMDREAGTLEVLLPDYSRRTFGVAEFERWIKEGVLREAETRDV